MSDLDSKAAAKAAKDAKRAAMVERLAPLTFEDGCVIQWERTFAAPLDPYVYVAVLVNEQWYISGLMAEAFTWEALVDRYLKYADSVWIMTASEFIA